MMNDKSDEVDWLGLSATARIEPTKALYKALRAVSQTTDRSLDLLMDDALGTVQARGTDYDANFRKGKIAAVKAKAIHRYLEENYFDQAKEAAPSLFQTNPKSAWNQFVEANAIEGRLRIVPMIKQMGIAQRSRDITESVTTLKLGQQYCLEIDCDGACTVVAFEGYQDQWHPLPLGSDARRLRTGFDAGTHLLPSDNDGQPIKLVELDDGGRHQFVVILSTDKTIPTDCAQIIQWTKTRDDAQVHKVEVAFV